MATRHALPSGVTFRLAAVRTRSNIDGMLAHAALALSLAVRVYDAHGVAPSAMTSARHSVDRIMSSAGIHVTWTQCPCDAAVGGAELVLRVVSAPPSATDSSELGFSYVDVQQRSGTLATVYIDRVHRLAQLADADEAELLGRAMAHEIAHLLLGTRDHASAGLMRGRWTLSELTTNRANDWLLSRSESARLQQALQRRLRGPATPAAVIAGDSQPTSVSAQ
jgi:hypothetical protein